MVLETTISDSIENEALLEGQVGQRRTRRAGGVECLG